MKNRSERVRCHNHKYIYLRPSKSRCKKEDRLFLLSSTFASDADDAEASFFFFVVVVFFFATFLAFSSSCSLCFRSSLACLSLSLALASEERKQREQGEVRRLPVRGEARPPDQD